MIMNAYRGKRQFRHGFPGDRAVGFGSETAEFFRIQGGCLPGCARLYSSSPLPAHPWKPSCSRMPWIVRRGPFIIGWDSMGKASGEPSPPSGPALLPSVEKKEGGRRQSITRESILFLGTKLIRQVVREIPGAAKVFEKYFGVGCLKRPGFSIQGVETACLLQGSL